MYHCAARVDNMKYMQMLQLKLYQFALNRNDANILESIVYPETRTWIHLMNLNKLETSLFFTFAYGIRKKSARHCQGDFRESTRTLTI